MADIDPLIRREAAERMARLKRTPSSGTADDGSLRLRAAWLYYGHKLTQKEVGDRLGLSRNTVMRLLDEAVKRSDVQIWIGGADGGCLDLAVRLEQALGLDEAIVVPRADAVDAAARSVGLALGTFLSGIVANDMTIGVGWGRTLSASLASFRPPHRQNVRVISLLGGVMQARMENPVDYSWQIASRLGAECFLYPAPLLVDSAETRRVLRERCGLDRLDRLAAALDVAVFSVGELGPGTTSLSRPLISREEHEALAAAGGVCDLMCNMLDADGRSVEHPVNQRVMSVDLSVLAQASHVVIAAGGERRAPAIRAAIRRVGCHTLVTDEGAAQKLLAEAGK
ncbi:sugar-binding transcriptional regulator [Rhizosaccharibacter radicis]|uniref:Sugar-binding transcriptional regulator n=1 Tax=Rhizosaccharibacter radicis TaxID=2782605 RepID=A0ABT1VZK2_9PROT|nr:sugar-binding transcriptional regulator [Acetobacteraceae bacterium KSS12]